jgi:AraC-like DNA-binding protein
MVEHAQRSALPSAVPGAMVIPSACNVLEHLRIGASLVVDGSWGIFWAAFRQHLGVLTLELEYAAWNDRHEYNEGCLRRARLQKKSVVGHHAGFFDLFVPVCVGDRVPAVIVTGPFATSRASGADLRERWQRVTGRQASLSDPEFAQYLELTLATLVLDSEQQAALQRLLERMAELMAEGCVVDNVHDAIKALDSELWSARFVEVAWEAAEAMVDARSTHIWTRPSQYGAQREALGLLAPPDQVAVGLFVSRRRDADPVDDRLRERSFQRACAELARARGNVVSGRVGAHGVTFLGVGRSSGARERRRFIDLAEEAARLAKRRFDLDVHWGVSAADATLPVQYQAALVAAESALSRGESLVHASAEPPSASALGSLKHDLVRQIREKPEALPARFDRFVEAATAHAGHRMDLVRVHLETTLEQLSETALEAGTLDPKSVESSRRSLASTLSRAHTLTEVCSAYRRAALDLAVAAQRPAPAHQERSLQRAEEYMREHFAEPITLRKVARVAGFAPAYFSHLFHGRHARTFVDYLTALRIDRAKELLAGTSLSVESIAKLSGISRAQYLSRVFKKSTSITPLEFRRRALRARALEYGRTPETSKRSRTDQSRSKGRVKQIAKK